MVLARSSCSCTRGLRRERGEGRNSKAEPERRGASAHACVSTVVYRTGVLLLSTLDPRPCHCARTVTEYKFRCKGSCGVRRAQWGCSKCKYTAFYYALRTPSTIQLPGPVSPSRDNTHNIYARPTHAQERRTPLTHRRREQRRQPTKCCGQRRDIRTSPGVAPLVHWLAACGAPATTMSRCVGSVPPRCKGARSGGEGIRHSHQGSMGN